MKKNSRIYISGHTGLVGSAVVRLLQKKGYRNLIWATHRETDLLNQSETDIFFLREKPEYVFHCAAFVGGIIANIDCPAFFIFNNLMMQMNVLFASHGSGVKKLIFLGSSCIYPRDAKQPMKEHDLLSGPFEPTNEFYAIAKVAGIKTCEAFRRQFGNNFVSVMPTNLYGPNDHYDVRRSHVIPALIKRFTTARQLGALGVEMPGTGTAKREFLHVDDLARALLLVMQKYDEKEPINIGSGEEITILELTERMRELIRYRGTISFKGNAKLDGPPRKVLDSSKIRKLGWKPQINLTKGLKDTIENAKL